MAAGYGAVGWVRGTMRERLRMTSLSCSAFFKSYVACRRSHISGELPKRRELLRHMTAERGLRSAKMP